ncbi:putative RNA-directed DNA polymerase from mobile element jockey-like [Penaeus vannamei]|uniref:Putative RNA-directed DNA polymerase from mobile element jockey-like n=1 Tax=Penaeus vannamei TaxID=6689 RepID=A0A423SAQ3_PENVA|nr:putative RNA-directed DNA polymerase from mobile element jockey-like [Penaeus vannamei]
MAPFGLCVGAPGRPKGCMFHPCYERSLAPRDNVTPLKNNLTTINKLAAKVTEAIFGLPIQAEAVSSETHWNNLRKAVYSSAKETLGHPQRHHQDWFEDNDEEIHNLLAEVRQCRQRVLSGQATRQATNKLKAAKAQLQTAICKMKNDWWLDKAAELQDFADAGNSKAFFDSLKAVYGPRQRGSNPVLSADGSQLHYTPSDILSRWREHFQGLLNRPSTVDNSAISRLNQHPTRSNLDIPPTEAELTVALKLLSNGKAPGADGIPAEVFKKGGHALHHELLVLFQTYWEAGNLPQDFRDATIIKLFKHKGDPRDCRNHRGISLLSTAGKILAKVVLMQLHKISKDVLPESQSGFRRGRGTVDMIFAFRQLQSNGAEHATICSVCRLYKGI